MLGELSVVEQRNLAVRDVLEGARIIDVAIRSISMIKRVKIDLGPVASHLLPVHDFAEAMRIAQEDPERMKVQFVFD